MTILYPPFKTQCFGKKKKKKKNSCYGNNKHVLFLKLRPELKKKMYIYIYIFTLKLSKTVLL